MAATEADPESFAIPDVSGFEDLLTAFLDPARPHLTDGELADGVVALDRLRCLADAALTTAVDRFDGRGVYGYDGARSASGWLRARTELSAAQAGEAVHRAQDLRSCPHVSSVFNDGIIGSAKVRLLLAARRGFEKRFAEHEADLVGFIRSLTVQQASAVLARWRATAEAEAHAKGDGDEPLPDPAEENSAHLSPHFEGRFQLNGDFDPVTGQMMADAINSHIDELFRSGAASKDDGIKRSKRVADALAELVLRGAQTGTTKQGQARPSITLNIDLGTLLGLPVDSPEGLRAQGCGLTNGTPILTSAAERLLCTADVTTIFSHLGLGGIVEPLGAVHSNRYPNAVERRALALRDQGCVFPGCDAPVDWSDAHHLDHWHLHGRTELSRVVLLCRFHHHAVHEGGYALDRSPTGVITATRPDGTPLPRAGPGQLIAEPDQPPGTGPPGRTPRIAASPATRFGPQTRRTDAVDRQLAWLTRRTQLELDPLGAEIARWWTETNGKAA